MSRRVLITGCSRGIGHALTEKFLHEGWEVFATARDARPLQALLNQAGDISVATLDVTNAHSVSAMAAEVGACWDSLDVLINNAAVFPGEGDEKLEDLKAESFGEAFDCNVAGIVRVTQALLPLLRKAPGARIANISSGAGSISEKEDYAYYPYSVSKAAVNMLTRAMAAEFRPAGIAVAALSPGWVQTEMGGAGAQITPQESARSLYQTITALTLKQSGCFLGRDGEPYAW